MASYITYCFSDWTKTKFANGIMRIRDGKRTDVPIRHPLPLHWSEGTDYYVKSDPDFKKLIYSHCHKRLRLRAKPGDTIFFRTLWRDKQYFIGYFTIKTRTGDPLNPILIANPEASLLIKTFTAAISPAMIRILNPRATARRERMYPPNIFAMFLGREFLALNNNRTAWLKKQLRGVASATRP